MLLRDGVDGLEVFMVVRHDALAFAAGALVFPGGSVDATDHALVASLGEAGTDAARVAAVRETFEECGILLARPRDADTLVGATALERLGVNWRRRIASGQTTLEQMLHAEGLVLAIDQLVHFAHWITPEAQAKRFDTHFFLAASPEGQLGAHDGEESVQSLWINPTRAVAAAECGHYKLVFATQLNLLKLARYATVEAALTAARAITVVTVLPVQEDATTAGTRHMRIPRAADYGGEHFVIKVSPPG
jgi:8-oxo-dGTP pyrophosphatase MutT (NUDIX family)